MSFSLRDPTGAPLSRPAKDEKHRILVVFRGAKVPFFGNNPPPLQAFRQPGVGAAAAHALAAPTARSHPASRCFLSSEDIRGWKTVGAPPADRNSEPPLHTPAARP